MLIVFNTPHISLSLSPPTLPPYLKLQGKRGLSEIWRDCTSISVFVCLVCLAHKLFLLISFPFYVLRFTSKNESSVSMESCLILSLVVCADFVFVKISMKIIDMITPSRAAVKKEIMLCLQFQFFWSTRLDLWNCKKFKSSRFHNSSLDDARKWLVHVGKVFRSPICFEKLFFSLSTSVFVFVRENFHENQKKNVLFLFSLRCRCGEIVEAPSLTAALAFHYLGLLLLFDFW